MTEQKSNGYFPLFRSIRDSWQWKQSAKTGYAWVWILLEAKYKDCGDLKRGQLKGSIAYWAQAWGMTKKQVRTFLSRCEREGDIQRQAGKGGHKLCCAQGIAEGIAEGIAKGIALTVITVLK